MLQNIMSYYTRTFQALELHQALFRLKNLYGTWKHVFNLTEESRPCVMSLAIKDSILQGYQVYKSDIIALS